MGVAGLRLQDQYIAAILETNTSVLQTGSAGIFGLGFPVNRSVHGAHSDQQLPIIHREPKTNAGISVSGPYLSCS